MSSSTAPSSPISHQSPGSSEDEKSNAAYRDASDPARQAARAAPYTANVPFMYNTVTEPSGGGGGPAEKVPITYGGDNDLQRHTRQADASQGRPYFQSAPSREQVRSAAIGGRGAIDFGAPEPTRVNAPQFDDGNVRIQYDSKSSHGSASAKETLRINTGPGDDNVNIERGKDGGLLAHVNGHSYAIPFGENPRNQQRVLINTGNGNDGVSVDYGGSQETIINAGAGDDTVYGGAGRTSVYGGDGSDVINLGSGPSYAEGNDGNDFITGGSGNAVIYGGRGSDELRAGGGSNSKVNYVDGGEGNDYISGGRGHNILHGGPGDDYIFGGDSNVIYTGRGSDTVQTYNAEDTVYGQRDSDDLSQLRSLKNFYDVAPLNVGRTGVRVSGSERFIQRTNDDLESMRSSPVGQGVLAKIDSLDAPVTIREGSEGSFYHYSDPGRANARDDDIRRLGLANGYISNGIPGVPAKTPVVTYQPNFITGSQRPPIVVLQHELAHAINGGEGTFLPGNTFTHYEGNTPVYETNNERQAVGLPTSHRPYHFSGPYARATSYNPWPFNENALLGEFRLPLRQRYLE
jgi:hypothetical protein